MQKYCQWLYLLWEMLFRSKPIHRQQTKRNHTHTHTVWNYVSQVLYIHKSTKSCFSHYSLKTWDDVGRWVNLFLERMHKCLVWIALPSRSFPGRIFCASNSCMNCSPSASRVLFLVWNAVMETKKNFSCFFGTAVKNTTALSETKLDTLLKVACLWAHI